MNINAQITSLAKKVDAATQELDMAVTFHEVWKPAIYDKDVIKRMGVSYATNAFHIVRTALRREMLLALMRLWDNDRRSVGVHVIADALRNSAIIDALAKKRAAEYKNIDVEVQMKKELLQQRDEIVALVEKYYSFKDRKARDVLKKLKALRNKRLAHRDMRPLAATGAVPIDTEIESFYQDMSKLISLLLHLVKAHGYDPQQTAEVFRFYASHFWAAVRGERTQGHPSYRAPRLKTSRLG
ncbi:MAG: hypothetical protein ABSA68_13805 [Xanthobacteraceae bacterium]